MTTYREIQDEVRRLHGFVPQTCWIADPREREGLGVRRAHNRRGRNRENPRPREKVEPIRRAIRRLG